MIDVSMISTYIGKCCAASQNNRDIQHNGFTEGWKLLARNMNFWRVSSLDGYCITWVSRTANSAEYCTEWFAQLRDRIAEELQAHKLLNDEFQSRWNSSSVASNVSTLHWADARHEYSAASSGVNACSSKICPAQTKKNDAERCDV
jgi:hypothetical protein